MKIKPQIYAKTLIESLSTDKKKVAANFWRILQKNKQYKELPKVLSMLDEEYAKQNNLILAKIYSDKPLNENQMAEIKKKLKQKSEKEILMQNIVKKNLTGIIAKIDDQIIDLSVENQVNRMKKMINK